MPAPSEPADDVVLARKPDLAIVDGDERAVILDLDRLAEPPIILDGSGRAVWDALREPRTAAEVVAEVAAHYGEDEATVEPAVRGFIGDLLGRGLLVASA